MQIESRIERKKNQLTRLEIRVAKLRAEIKYLDKQIATIYGDNKEITVEDELDKELNELEEECIDIKSHTGTKAKKLSKSTTRSKKQNTPKITA